MSLYHVRAMIKKSKVNKKEQVPEETYVLEGEKRSRCESCTNPSLYGWSLISKMSLMKNREGEIR